MNIITKTVYGVKCDFEYTDLGMEFPNKSLLNTILVPTFKVVADTLQEATDYVYTNWDALKTKYSTKYINITKVRSISIYLEDVCIDEKPY